MFAKYDGDQDGALTLGELFEMMHGNRCAADPFGWGAAFFEWGTTWLLIQRDGRVYKEDLRGVYDVCCLTRLTVMMTMLTYDRVQYSGRSARRGRREVGSRDMALEGMGSLVQSRCTDIYTNTYGICTNASCIHALPPSSSGQISLLGRDGLGLPIFSWITPPYRQSSMS
jgi:hypothetical protein